VPGQHGEGERSLLSASYAPSSTGRASGNRTAEKRIEGANATIFSVCEAVLFRPLPYPEPERLVMLWERVTRDGRLGGVAPANFVDWRERSGSFEYLAALDPFPEFTLIGQGEPERVAGAGVSSALFPLLGTRMAIGRNFVPDEDKPGQNSVVILSYETVAASLRRRPFDDWSTTHTERHRLPDRRRSATWF
jgi:hypothetical protein